MCYGACEELTGRINAAAAINREKLEAINEKGCHEDQLMRNRGITALISRQSVTDTIEMSSAVVKKGGMYLS